MQTKTFIGAGSFLLGLLASLSADAGSKPVFQKLADTSLVAPDGQAVFTIDRPQMAGSRIVFIAATPAPDVYLFGVSATGGAPVDLVDTSTKVPGGTGTFTGSQYGYFTPFEPPGCSSPAIGDTHAVFVGRDAAGNQGVYSVPFKGGKVKKLVDYTDAIPGGPVGSYSNFNVNYSFCNLSVSGETVLYDAGASGVYSVDTDGKHLTRIADPNTPATFNDFVVNQYNQPTVSVGKITYVGSTVFGPYGIFVGPPGKKAAIVRADRDVFDSLSYPTIADQSIRFEAHLDYPNQGLFSVAPDGSKLTKVMDFSSKLPKGTPGTAFNDLGSSSNGENWSPAGDMSIFAAQTTDGSAIYAGLFKACKANLSKILTQGDMLDGVEVEPGAGVSNLTVLDSGAVQGAILVGGFRYAAIYTVTVPAC